MTPVVTRKVQLEYIDAESLKNQWSFFVLLQFVLNLTGYLMKIFLPDSLPILNQLLTQTSANGVFLYLFVVTIAIDIAMTRAIDKKQTTLLRILTTVGFLVALPITYVWIKASYSFIIVIKSEGQDLEIRNNGLLAIIIGMASVGLALWLIFLLGKLYLAFNETLRNETNIIEYSRETKILDAREDNREAIKELFINQYERVYGNQKRLNRGQKLETLGNPLSKPTRVLKVNDRFVGFYTTSRDRLTLEKLYIQGAYEHLGYGKIMLDDFELTNAIRKNKKLRVLVEGTNTSAPGFLEKYGWNAISTNRKRVVYEKKLIS